MWINAQLGSAAYDPAMWEVLSRGKPVEVLWERYCEFFCIGGDKRRPPSKPPVVKPVLEDVSIQAPAVLVYNAAPPTDRATVTVTQPTNPVDGSVPSSTGYSISSSASEYDPFALSGKDALAAVFAKRLKNLTFDGTRDGKRFVKEFEGLVVRVFPRMSDEDKRLLLVWNSKTVVLILSLLTRAYIYIGDVLRRRIGQQLVRGDGPGR